MQIRKERLQSIILKNVSLTLNNEVRDPDVGFVTVTDVSLTNDYSFAKVYVTFLDNKDMDEKRMAALNKVKGLVRTRLAQELSIRKTPEIIFVLDKSLQQGNHIDQLLKDLNK